jgi:protein-tyrosine phosphatase
MARLLWNRVLDPGGFAARQLEDRHVVDAGLVLTMTARQRAQVVGRVPGAVRRTFTLSEFAGLALLTGEPGASTVPGRLAALVRAAPAARGRRVQTPFEDDIEDPYGRDEAAYVRALDLITSAVTDLGSVLVGPGGRAPARRRSPAGRKPPGRVMTVPGPAWSTRAGTSQDSRGAQA